MVAIERCLKRHLQVVSFLELGGLWKNSHRFVSSSHSLVLEDTRESLMHSASAPSAVATTFSSTQYNSFAMTSRSGRRRSCDGQCWCGVLDPASCRCWMRSLDPQLLCKK